MQKQSALVTKPPQTDPANKEKYEKLLLHQSNMDLNKAALIMYLQS